MSNFLKSIVSYLTKNKEIPLNKTKLIKILYLIDVEYYRLYGEQLFELEWVYFKYGPYDYNFDKLLTSSNIEINKTPQSHFITVSENFDLEHEIDSTIPDTNGQVIIKRIIDQFGEYDLSRLLDVVYFCTEPMSEPIKIGDSLDFSKIDTNNPPFQKRNLKRSDPKKLKNIRKEIKKKKIMLKKSKENFVSEDRSDFFYEQMELLDKENVR